MSIPTVRFGGTDYALETLGNLSGPELVKLHNNCAGLIGLSETKRFSDKQSALKRTWAVLVEYGSRPTVEKYVAEAQKIDGAEQAVTSGSSDPEVGTDKHEESEVAAAKKKAPAKPAKKAVEPSVGRGFPEDAKIKILVKENPRRGEAAARFELYKNGMTVAEYSKKIGSRAEALVHLRWDVNKGHISVG